MTALAVALLLLGAGRPGAVPPTGATPPASSPGFRTVAESCDSERPRRSTATSISSAPAATGAANTVLTERRRCSGAASSAIIARTATALTMPPCGSVGAPQMAGRSARQRPGRPPSLATTVWREKSAPSCASSGTRRQVAKRRAARNAFGATFVAARYFFLQCGG